MRSVADARGNRIELTGAEFDLLQVFLDRPGRVLSRDQLLDLTRGREGDVFDRSIDVLVSRLRRKLDTFESPRLFKTVRNGGYQLIVKVELLELRS
jgi:two-component system phosphate regulon response regulator OmpR